MERIIAATCALGLLTLLPACASPNRAIFDELDARAASGNRAAIPPSPAALTAEPAPQGTPVEASMPIPMTTLLLPRSAAPAPEIAGLEFLSGRWVAVNPNRTVNEEIWSSPRGNALLGSFRQIQSDGDCSFVELSQIMAESGGIVLRLRHLGGHLEVPEDQSDVSVFRLVSLTKDRVEFAGTESVSSVVYQRTSPTELEQLISFTPESGQTNFVTHYFLER